MSYETGTASSPGDLLAKLFDFASANGWTIDEDIVSGAQVPPQGAMHIGNLYVSFYFFSGSLKIYPARGYTPLSDPGDHPESKYNDVLTTEVTTNGLMVNEITGPYSAYHFFESDTYIHIVIQLPTGSFRHFGFGVCNKFGDWQHGEYFYGHYWSQTANFTNVPTNTSHNRPFDGAPGGSNKMVMYAAKNDNTDMPGVVGAGSRWFSFYNTSSGVQYDADGRPLSNMFNHTAPTGNMAMPIMGLSPSSYNGFIPLIPMMFGNVDYSTTPDQRWLLGTFPDVRAVNVGGINAGVERVIGSDTWMIFPVTRADGDGSNANQEWSANMGLAYKKVTA